MILPIKGLAAVDAGRVRNAALPTGVDVPSPVGKGISVRRGYRLEHE